MENAVFKNGSFSLRVVDLVIIEIQNVNIKVMQLKCKKNV